MSVTLSNNNDNRGFWALVLLILSIVLLVLLKRCEPKLPTPINIPELHIKDSFRTVIKYHDSVRVHHLNKWKLFKEQQLKDTTNPCNTEIRFVIQKADTVIKADSSLISSQRELIKLDSIIQLKQDSIISQKSDSIKTLTRKLKWAKLKTNGVITLWILREGVVVAEKIKP